MRRLVSFVLVATLSAFGGRAHATFSITAVDLATGEVGSAGASCIPGSIILSDVLPGIGVIHTQSYWNGTNQALAHSLMLAGFSPEEIIDELVANDATGDPELRQYAITDLVDGGRSAGYTGADCIPYANHFLNSTFAVAGNILLHPTVLLNMEAAFTGTEGTLGDRLMAALQGANLPGADTRCQSAGKPAISAFIRVGRPDDAANDLYLDLNVNNTAPSENPIDLLQELYDEFVGTVSVPESIPVVRLAVSPNPFPASVRVRYALDAPGTVCAWVLNAAGQRVDRVVDGWQSSGVHTIEWDGSTFPLGVYFLRIDAPTWRETARVVRAR